MTFYKDGKKHSYEHNNTYLPSELHVDRVAFSNSEYPDEELLNIDYENTSGIKSLDYANRVKDFNKVKLLT